jgi:hypothetical protein
MEREGVSAYARAQLRRKQPDRPPLRLFFFFFKPGIDVL